MNDVWVIDDDRSMRWVLERALSKADLEVTSFDSATNAMQALQQELPKVIITDVRMPGMDGFEFLQQVQSRYPDLPVIVMTAHSDLENAVSAYQGGAFEYLPKPFDVDDAVELTKKACSSSRSSFPESQGNGSTQVAGIIGESPAMQEVFRAIGRLSRSSITVLINGETGTGKELVAHALHRHSLRKDKPFIALNMAAIPHDLLESELFGHEKGAFTGAQLQRRGRFEQADGGTLFLDEIGDMPSELQTRLLRVLSDGEFYRVGGLDAVKVNVRIIAATHQNLENLVKEGRFREDLLHRLNVIRLYVPALRKRRQDIPILVNYFLDRAARELEVDVKKPTDAVLEYLSALEWPGNVRQLENICRWLTVMASGQLIQLEDLPPELKHRETNDATPDRSWQLLLSQWADQKLNEGAAEILSLAVPQLESILIESAMRKTGGKRQQAAKLLGWGRNTLTRKIQELKLYEYSEPQHEEANR